MNSVPRDIYSAEGLARLGLEEHTVKLDLRTATAGQLQDAARRRHAELAAKIAKLTEEAAAHRNEMALLEEMLPKQETKA